MKGLKRFKDSYDVIVVGSGNGGMSAALKCAREGLDTLLLEKHNLIGGFATSYVRGRYEFEASLHELCEYGDGELDTSLGLNTPKTRLRRFFEDECGVDFEPVVVPSVFRVIDDRFDLDFVLPLGEKNVVEAIRKKYPQDAPKVEEYLKLCREITAALEDVESNPGLSKLTILQKYNSFVRMAGYSVAEVHEKFAFSPAVKAIMDTLVTYLAIDDKDLPFVLYAFMLHMYIAQGPMIPKHTSHEIATKAELALRRMGAQVECCCPVKHFLSDGKQVCGVELADGTQIHAKRVICNANQTLAVTSMIPAELVPSRMKKLYNVRELTCNTYTVAFGLDDTPEHLGITDYECFIGHIDLDKLDGMAHTWTKPPFICGTCPDVAIPGHTGPDRCQLNFTVIYYTDAMEGALDQKTYAPINEELAEYMIDMYEKGTGATLRGHIEEMVVATPSTFSHLCNSFRGDIYGYKPTVLDSIVTRRLAMEKDRMVPGLLFCGAGELRGAGYDCAMMSGIIAGEIAAKELKEA